MAHLEKIISWKKLILLLSITIFIFYSFLTTLPTQQPTTRYYSGPDADVDFLISQKVAQGGKLYEDFSIVYPPGRFLVQGLLFQLFSQSVVVNSIFHSMVASGFFTVGLFILSWKILYPLLKNDIPSKYSILVSPSAYILAILSSYIYVTFIESAQEVHLISVIFFLLLLSKFQNTQLKQFLLGFIVGLIFLFRIDGGIMILISMIFAGWESIYKIEYRQIEYWKSSLIGFFVIWLPILGAIIFHGSLLNFLYDTLILGLFIQPRFMSLPIPENDLGLVFLSTLILIIGISISMIKDSKKFKSNTINFGWRAFAAFVALSYVSALGRSDEAHLWYGLVWISVLLIYGLIRILLGVFNKERLSLLTVAVATIITYFYSWTILEIKSPFLLLISFPVLATIILKSKLDVFSTLIASFFTAGLVFHSFSYLQLRYSPLVFPNITNFKYEYINSASPEIGGMIMDEDDKQILDSIREDIPSDETYLFLFPTNLMLHPYLGLKNPTRHIAISLERSNFTEQQIISDLDNTRTKYFLIFSEAAILRHGKVWNWILENTEIEKTYSFQTETAELRIRKDSN